MTISPIFITAIPLPTFESSIGDDAPPVLPGRAPEDRRRRKLGKIQTALLGSIDPVSTDGTLIEAWPSMKSFKPKDDADGGDTDGSGSGAEGKQPPKATGRNPERDFHGEKRSNATHASTTDPAARLYKKARGQAAKLCHMGDVTMENRNGPVVDATLTHATGTAEREAGLDMLGRTMGAIASHWLQTKLTIRPTLPPPCGTSK